MLCIYDDADIGNIQLHGVFHAIMGQLMQPLYNTAHLQLYTAIRLG